jgi:hypothetical protein
MSVCRQVISKLRAFREKWLASASPELFAITLDISKCYDSIDSKVLLDMFKNSKCVEESYLINRYTLLTRNKRPLARDTQSKGRSALRIT